MRQLLSRCTMAFMTTGVGVKVIVDVGVSVGVGVIVGVYVAVAVGVDVLVDVGVEVGVSVGADRLGILQDERTRIPVINKLRSERFFVRMFLLLFNPYGSTTIVHETLLCKGKTKGSPRELPFVSDRSQAFGLSLLFFFNRLA